jgi:hypothetical protein
MHFFGNQHDVEISATPLYVFFLNQRGVFLVALDVFLEGR